MRKRGWIVGMLVVVLGACGSERAAEAPPLELEAARTLVADAASVDRSMLESFVNLGAKLTPAEAEAAPGGMSLTVAAMILRLPEEDFRFRAHATPATMMRAIDPRDKTLGLKLRARPSLLDPDHVEHLSLSRTDDRVEGEVRFKAGDVYAGRVEFKARYRDGAWAVTEFLFPASKIRLVLQDGRWRMQGGKQVTPPPRTGVNLPQVTHVGGEPAAESRIVIRLTGRGVLTMGDDATPLSLRALHDGLVAECKRRGPKWEEVDGASALHAVLEIDRTVPWKFVQWIMQTCAHPDVKIYKIAFRAVTRTTKKAGAILTELPKDRGGPGLDGITRKRVRRIKVFKTERGPTDLRAVWAALQKTPIEQRRETSYEIVAPPPKGGAVSTGFVVQLVDLVLRAGGTRLTFEGAAMPRDTIGDAAWLAAEVTRERPGNVFVRIEQQSLDPDAPQADLPADGVFPQVRIVAPAMGTIIEEEVLEEVIEEPVIVDEEDEAPGVNVGIRDHPSLERSAFRSRGIRRPQDETDAQRRASKAVELALAWLGAHQAADGSWQARDFGRWCDGKVIADESKVPQGAGKPLYDVGVTGLALSAFLSEGYTNRGRHPYAKVVSRGLRYLKNVQDPEGCFGARNTMQYVYNHAMAALAMVEAYGMTGSPIFKGSAQRCLDFVALARNPYFAWRYGIKPGDNDTSVTAWMTTALKSAALINANSIRQGKPAPLSIDENAFKGVRAWLEKITDTSNGRAGYVTRGTGPARPQEEIDAFPGEASEAMTAAAIWAQITAGTNPATSEVIRKGLTLLDELPPLWKKATGRIDMYYWYYGTLATHQAGGSHWERWAQDLDKAVTATQRTDGDVCTYKGSWDPAGPWGKDGGRVYATALMTLSLQVRYRYERFFR